ncbi:hypothetical protein AB9K17_23840, partial [Salmonella enterica subsp. enterica serovar Kentucky]|uniref:hypothetical protein n=1 Tax=Salmonella enterica TaxID=28901 RepID=UPI003F4B2656
LNQPQSIDCSNHKIPGNRGVRRVENLYTSGEGSSHSSLQTEQRVNRVEEGKCGEKHVYHVLEKPGGDDYEEIDKTLEKNTALEYETPVPSNEL